MRYIVLWTVLLTVQAECPDYKSDPYTGQYPMTHCLVLHYKTIKKDMRQEFSTRKEAEDFIAKAPEEIRKTMTIQELKIQGHSVKCVDPMPFDKQD